MCFGIWKEGISINKLLLLLFNLRFSKYSPCGLVFCQIFCISYACTLNSIQLLAHLYYWRWRWWQLLVNLDYLFIKPSPRVSFATGRIPHYVIFLKISNYIIIHSKFSNNIIKIVSADSLQPPTRIFTKMFSINILVFIGAILYFFWLISVFLPHHYNLPILFGHLFLWDLI